MKMTVIIPTRNRANTLRYALLTCTAQAYEDLEIIVSDNCSDDDTEAPIITLGGSNGSESRLRNQRKARFEQ